MSSTSKLDFDELSPKNDDTFYGLGTFRFDLILKKLLNDKNSGFKRMLFSDEMLKIFHDMVSFENILKEK